MIFLLFVGKPQMKDVRVRQAIDAALSRNALSQALQGGEGTRSFFPDNTPFFSDSLAGDANEEDTRGPNYNAAAAGFQGLSLGDGAMTPDKSANSTESQDHLVWDNIPASQPDSYTSLRRKKLSRGILGTNPAARAGPSKRIRMQERD